MSSGDSSLDKAMALGRLVPGFDFLQGLAQSAVKGAGQGLPQMPNLSHWIAPTLNVEDLEKRIEELKAVQFWLDQNATALKATIQALEVQKMTLATLKGMNFNMADVANAFKLKAGEVMAGAAAPTPKAAAPAAPAAPRKPAAPRRKAGAATAAPAPAATGVVDPMQWWGALTQQFQQIATHAMREAATRTAADTTRNLATGLAKGAVQGAVKGATDVARAATQTAARAVGGAARAGVAVAGQAVAAGKRPAPARAKRVRKAAP